jgi:L-aminopeptidase/D-esterase-like protein
MCCYGFKGGSGTSSRLVAYGDDTYVVGVFVQANFGQRRELTIAGVPIGRSLADDDPVGEYFARAAGAGSVIAVVVTDAPLLPHQCAALSRRVTIGLARTGTAGSHFSGDLFLAVSTANPGSFASADTSLHGGAAGGLSDLRFVPWAEIDPLYEAVAQATEEAVIDSLVANQEMIGNEGHRVPALPHERVLESLREYRVLPGSPPA